jgi:hypothetical protein
MPTWPDYEVPPVTPVFITSVSRYSAARTALRLSGSNATSAVWTPASSGNVTYIPFYLPFAYLVQRIFWWNGSTVTSTSIECAVHGQDGTKLLSSGLIAMGTASASQFQALAAPMTLPKGAYWFSHNIVAATLTSRGNGFAPTSTYARLAGLLQQSGQTGGTPNAATFGSYVGPGIPLMGITRTASGF